MKKSTSKKETTEMKIEVSIIEKEVTTLIKEIEKQETLEVQAKEEL